MKYSYKACAHSHVPLPYTPKYNRSNQKNLSTPFSDYLQLKGLKWKSYRSSMIAFNATLPLWWDPLLVTVMEANKNFWQYFFSFIGHIFDQLTSAENEAKKVFFFSTSRALTSFSTPQVVAAWHSWHKEITRIRNIDPEKNHKMKPKNLNCVFVWIDCGRPTKFQSCGTYTNWIDYWHHKIKKKKN